MHTAVLLLLAAACVCVRAVSDVAESTPLANVACDTTEHYCVVGWGDWPRPFPQLTTSPRSAYFNYTFYINPYGPTYNTSSLQRAHACRQSSLFPPFAHWATQILGARVHVDSWCTDVQAYIAVPQNMRPAFIMRGAASSVSNVVFATNEYVRQGASSQAGNLFDDDLPPHLAATYVNTTAENSPAMIDVAVVYVGSDRLHEFTGGESYPDIRIENIVTFGASGVRVASSGRTVNQARIDIDGMRVTGVTASPYNATGGYALSLVGTRGTVTVGDLDCAVLVPSTVGTEGPVTFECAQVAMLRDPGAVTANETTIVALSAVTVTDITSLVSYPTPLLPRPANHTLVGAPSTESTVGTLVIVVVVLSVAVIAVAVIAACECHKQQAHARKYGSVAVSHAATQQVDQAANAIKRRQAAAIAKSTGGPVPGAKRAPSQSPPPAIIAPRMPMPPAAVGRRRLLYNQPVDDTERLLPAEADEGGTPLVQLTATARGVRL